MNSITYQRLNDFSSSKWTSLLSQLKVEPFIFIYMFTYSLSSVPITQLAQDKLCRFEYHKGSYYCVNINSQQNYNDPIKSRILADVSYFYLYRTMVSTFPCVIWSLFIGSWSDKYIHGRKILMCAGAIGAILETIILMINAYSFESSVYLMILASVPSAFFGGIIGTLLAVYAYCSATSDAKTRMIRFALLEVAFWIPQPLGTFVGGQILGSGDEKSEKQLYNYTTVFIISLILQISALVWVLVFINERKSQLIQSQSSITIVHRGVFDPSYSSSSNQESSWPNEYHQTVGRMNIGVNQSFESINSITDSIETVASTSSMTKLYAQINNLFDISNVKDIIATCTKPRPNHARLEIWLLFMSISCIMLSYIGSMLILWQFVERAFSWTSKTYSNVNSIVSVIQFISMAIIILVLVKKLKIRDSLLGIIGVISLFMQNLIRGSWQQETGFYLSYLFGSLSSITPIAIRSRLSKIVDPDEHGKVFSLLATIEALTPTLASLFYSSIFAASIDYYPGLTFQIAAAILFVPLIILIWIDLYNYV